jgi:hypothetical protein
MKKVVERQRNKIYYRVLHVPIWIWVFFILPGHLTADLYSRGPDWRHGIWLAAVTAVCAWRGFAGRLPGVEPKPYINYWGVDEPNLGYRVVCYTAAWIDLLVPFTINFLGLLVAVATGKWYVTGMYKSVYYVLAGAIVVAAVLNQVPRAKRSTLQEGAERAWFYVAIWTVVPAQTVSWAMWRLGPKLGLAAGWELDLARLLVFVFTAGLFLALGVTGKLGRTARYYAPDARQSLAATAAAPE